MVPAKATVVLRIRIKQQGLSVALQPGTIRQPLVVGYIIALAMTPLGFAIGLELMLSPGVRSKHGVCIVLVSTAAYGGRGADDQLGSADGNRPGLLSRASRLGKKRVALRRKIMPASGGRR